MPPPLRRNPLQDTPAARCLWNIENYRCYTPTPKTNPYCTSRVLQRRGTESTNNRNRNRKSPRFSVANVPVARQTTVGTLFYLEKWQKNRNRQRLSVARKNGKPASENRNRNRRKIATLGALRRGIASVGGGAGGGSRCKGQHIR